MKDNLCKIISNQELCAGYYRMTLEKQFESFQPGQFCMFRIPGLGETLLRRPFSLCQEDKDTFDIVYKDVGPTTAAMSRLKPADHLQALGPLGRGLNWSGYSRVVGIAGGYGIAPLLGLGRHLKDSSVDYEVFYGARSQSDLLLIEDFAKLGIEVHVSTEDGSQGFRGKVTELVAKQTKSNDADPAQTLWFVCGPHGLLKAAVILANECGVHCEVSMEEYMGCGIGVCLGCVVQTREGEYVRSCVEGPVMNSETVKW